MSGLCLLAVPVGAVIGLSLGALGGGGSILTVPALVYLLRQSAHGATTASLVIVGVTAIAGAAAHARAGRVRLASGLAFGALGTAGSVVGARLSAGVSSEVLLTAFAGLVLLAAGAMLARLRRAPLSPSAGPSPGGDVSASAGLSPGSGPSPTGPGAATAGPPAANRLWKWARVVVAATIVGVLTGFFGVGGGFVVVPALVLALGFQMPVAVGTSLLVIAINSASALLGRLGTHAHLNWTLVGVFIMAAVAGSLAGNRLASLARPERLALAFTGLLVAVAIYTAVRSVPHLA